MPSKAARKKDGWKDVQHRTKVKSRNKLALAVLACVGLLLFLSWGIRFTQSLFTPWKQDSHIDKKYIWNKEFNINLLIKTDRISLFSFNPKEDKITIINIPDETFVDVASGFGSWQLRAVYGLGGDKLLKDTLRLFLAVPIDGFLDFSQAQSSKSAMQLLDSVRKSPISGFELLSGLKTDLTAWELLRLKTSINGVRFDKIKELDLDQLGVLEKEELADGTPIFNVDPVRLDSILSVLADPAVVSEHKTIAVLNATDHPQLANQWARLIANLGGNVIITTNSEKKFQKTQVLGEESLTLTRLRQIFGLNGNINPSLENMVSSRAQINVIIGEDYFNK